MCEADAELLKLRLEAEASAKRNVVLPTILEIEQKSVECKEAVEQTGFAFKENC